MSLFIILSRHNCHLLISNGFELLCNVYYWKFLLIVFAVSLQLTIEQKENWWNFTLRPNQLFKPNVNIKDILQLEKLQAERQYGRL